MSEGGRWVLEYTDVLGFACVSVRPFVRRGAGIRVRLVCSQGTHRRHLHHLLGRAGPGHVGHDELVAIELVEVLERVDHHAVPAKIVKGRKQKQYDEWHCCCYCCYWHYECDSFFSNIPKIIITKIKHQ